MLSRRGPFATLSSNLQCLRLSRRSATNERDPTILGSQTFPDWERTWKVFDKRVLFSHFYFLLFLFSVNFVLSYNWHWLWFLVGRELQNNQLKDLPEGIFRNNTKLRFLWVDLFIQPLISISKFLMSQAEEVSTVPISIDIMSLTWYGYDIMFIWPNFDIVKT